MVLAAVLSLAGCVLQQKIWFKPGVTDEETERDYTECLQGAEGAMKAYSSPGSGALGTYGNSGGAIAATAAPEVRSCMEGKGYHLVDRRQTQLTSPRPY